MATASEDLDHIWHSDEAAQAAHVGSDQERAVVEEDAI